ncbi:cytidine deaminase [Diplocloster agilis]|uniref:Cytidine deaminase n=1 Tax=Diplocloster agilis TaxID=2850323 RepID=A0A949K2F9_9FIRM|nr:MULTISPECIES: cytidine deaminase [Lachnospiraceae]MBU9738974.1 cytidine deaminase [Diplocloster agilis]MCU6735917.1 cytidine deaminase [Suonthocola fibrivorans]SCJ84053.1 Cytidine deaminase [uncultured Clostridium sp.]
METEELALAACKARKMSYAPYSGFTVGAALLCSDGSVYLGCNIENAAYGPTICAERTAIFKAISDGKRDFVGLALTGGSKDQQPEHFLTPCGVCRQVLAEFCENDFWVLSVKNDAEYMRYVLGELLPVSFRPENMRNKMGEGGRTWSGL